DDEVAESVDARIQETQSGGDLQHGSNAAQGLTPESIKSSIRELPQTVYERDYYTVPVEEPATETFESPAALQARIGELEARMKEAAKRLDFEHAAELRDRLKALRKQQIT